MMLRNCRILPGQSCACSAAMASSEMCGAACAAPRETREEMADQLRNILAAFAKRRQPHRNDVEAIKQVLAETPGGDLVLEVARGRRQDAHVDLDGPLAADAVIALVGQHAQDLGLGRQRHVGDLVEEQRAAMRMLEQAGRTSPSASVPNSSSSTRSGLIIAAGQHDERRLGARAPLMDHPRGDFLADAGRARDQYPAAGRRDALQVARTVLMATELPCSWSSCPTCWRSVSFSRRSRSVSVARSTR